MTSPMVNDKKAKLVVVAASAVAIALFLGTFAAIWNPLQPAQAISYKGVTRVLPH